MQQRQFLEFDWDKGNIDKNRKHEVENAEIEEVFSNWPLIIVPDTLHSQKEERFAALGKTNGGRLLTIVFTPREMEQKIRPISARAMNRRERAAYEAGSEKSAGV